MFNCPYCEKTYDKLISLSIHCRKGHKKSSKQFYVDFNLNGVEPTCKCGCGDEVKLKVLNGSQIRFILHNHQDIKIIK